jgi:hypothetical protein
MKLQNNFTTIEQSKRLLELGVPADSADCFYDHYRNLEVRTYSKLASTFFETYTRFTPCWSVGRLMEIYHICIPNTSIYGWSYHEDVDGSYIDYIIQEYIDAYGELDFSKLEE